MIPGICVRLAKNSFVAKQPTAGSSIQGRIKAFFELALYYGSDLG
jgi:hypothetical protein